MAKRIQRKRTKGWRLPPNTVCVSRPSKWGNPFRVDMWGKEGAVEMFRGWMGMMKAAEPDRYHAMLESLRGKDLACWCKEGEACHADVLLELANA